MEVHPGLFGRFHHVEPLEALIPKLHFHDGSELKEVSHDIPAGVLDQQDLTKQGIFTDQLIPGAPRAVALGSCTANATVAFMSAVLPKADFELFIGALHAVAFQADIDVYAAVKLLEEAAILFYHGCTGQTGDPGKEWPPTDCGSTGAYVYQYLVHLGFIKSEKVAHGPDNLVSLLQGGPVLEGTPFLNAWMEPDASGFVDGDGSMTTVEGQIRLGVAGGHETVIRAIERLALTLTGKVDPYRTVLRVRNSWGKSWGDNGEFLIHLSTLAVVLGSYCDFRQPAIA